MKKRELRKGEQIRQGQGRSIVFILEAVENQRRILSRELTKSFLSVRNGKSQGQNSRLLMVMF